MSTGSEAEARELPGGDAPVGSNDEFLLFGWFGYAHGPRIPWSSDTAGLSGIGLSLYWWALQLLVVDPFPDMARLHRAQTRLALRAERSRPWNSVTSASSAVWNTSRTAARRAPTRTGRFSALWFLSFDRYPDHVAVTLRSDGPAAFVAAVREAVERGECLHLNVGDSACEIDGALAQGVLALLDAPASGTDVELMTLPAELTTGQAADLLGVSRPTVVSLIDKGGLAATRIGSHRRLRTADVLAYRARARRNRSAALDEVVAGPSVHPP